MRKASWIFLLAIAVSCGTKKEKEEVTNKLQDLATGRGWKILDEMPVFRRRRDEHDTLVDVMFYNKVDRDLENLKLADSTD